MIKIITPNCNLNNLENSVVLTVTNLWFKTRNNSFIRSKLVVQLKSGKDAIMQSFFDFAFYSILTLFYLKLTRENYFSINEQRQMF
jgi:hypothetical protein